MLRRNRKLIKILSAAICVGLLTVPSYPVYAADNNTSTSNFAGDHFMYKENAVDSNGVNWMYGINYDSTINVSLNGKTDKTNIVVPETLNGHTVSKIDDNAFLNNASNLESIKIPASVKNIGYNAFKGCSKLSEIDIPTSVAHIGAHAFDGTIYLVNKKSESPLVIVNDILVDGQTATGDITLPSNVTSIADEAFTPNGVAYQDLNTQDYSNCSKITSIMIPSSVKSIGTAAFYGCPELNKITIDGNPKITDSAFNNCKKLSEVTIPDCVNIGEAFKGTPWFSCSDSSFKIVNGVLKDGTNAEGDIVIPHNVTSISFNAFKNNDKITSVTIPSRVDTIGINAFSGCKNLRSVTINQGNKRDDNNYYYGLIHLCKGAFSGCESLTSIELPPSVQFVGPSAFSDCTNLEEASLKKAVIDEIKDFTFHGCPNLKKVTLPDTLHSISDNAFDNSVRDSLNLKLNK